MLKILDKILLSDNVIQKFYDEYEKEDFKKDVICLVKLACIFGNFVCKHNPVEVN